MSMTMSISLSIRMSMCRVTTCLEKPAHLNQLLSLIVFGSVNSLP